MKKIKQFLKLSVLTCIVAITFSSCLTTKTQVGAYRERQGEEYTYSKGKQIWIFWSLIPIGRTKVSTPADGACEVITRFNLSDFLISGLTGGLITTETIKIKAKKSN